MTATYRHDVGLELADKIRMVFPEEVWGVLGGYRTSRWGGVGKGYREVWTFAVKLPRGVADAYWLLEACDRLMVGHNRPAVRSAAHTLLRKLVGGLGLPQYVLGDRPRLRFNEWPQGLAFLEAIHADPADLASWSAYADWLQEQDCPDRQLRGRVIAGWLGPKAVKVKYGLPVLMRNDSEGRKARGEV